MRIKIDFKILLFILLFCITSQIEIYLLLMIFAMIHELGHLGAGLILGFQPQEIAITPIGMKIEFKPKYEEYNRKIRKANALAIKRAIVAMAGPMTNFAIIMFTILITNIFPTLLDWNMLHTNYVTIIYSNLLIGIFNLIPIYPLDGGRIIKEILHIIVGLQKSYTYTYQISKVTIVLLTIIASIAILYIQNISVIVILSYLWGIMLVERKRYYIKKLLFEQSSSLAIKETEKKCQKCKIKEIF